MPTEKPWLVRAASPKDYFPDLTLGVKEWLEIGRRDQQPSRQPEREQSDFLDAQAAVEQHPYWEPEERHEPHVGYDPIDDSYYFIFKIDNNGTTFFVSQRDMTELAQDSLTI